MKVLILYASVEGQTKRIAEFIQDQVITSGHSTTVVDAGQKGASLPPQDFDRVILAASIHRQRHPVLFERLVSRSRKELASQRTLMISVSLCAAFREGLDEAQSYLEELRRRTGFAADSEALVAGALQFGKYHDYESQVVRLIGLNLKQYKAVDGDREFTNWSDLKRTVSEFLHS